MKSYAVRTGLFSEQMNHQATLILLSDTKGTDENSVKKAMYLLTPVLFYDLRVRGIIKMNIRDY